MARTVETLEVSELSCSNLPGHPRGVLLQSFLFSLLVVYLRLITRALPPDYRGLPRLFLNRATAPNLRLGQSHLKVALSGATPSPGMKRRFWGGGGKRKRLLNGPGAWGRVPTKSSHNSPPAGGEL